MAHLFFGCLRIGSQTGRYLMDLPKTRPGVPSGVIVLPSASFRETMLDTNGQPIFGSRQPNRLPEPGALVMCTISERPGAFSAWHWGVDPRPTYRLCMQFAHESIDHLTREFPVERDGDNFPIEHPEETLFFEKLLPDGSWISCPDPRTLPAAKRPVMRVLPPRPTLQPRDRVFSGERFHGDGAGRPARSNGERRVLNRFYV